MKAAENQHRDVEETQNHPLALEKSLFSE